MWLLAIMKYFTKCVFRMLQMYNLRAPNFKYFLGGGIHSNALGFTKYEPLQTKPKLYPYGFKWRLIADVHYLLTFTMGLE